MTSAIPTPVEKPDVDVASAARSAVDVASDRQAMDVVLLDVREISAFNDYMVIMSADNPRQVGALVDELEKAITESGLRLHHIEGTQESGWVLLDFSDIVIHVFSEEQRGYYRLDEVWRAAKTLVRLQ